MRRLLVTSLALLLPLSAAACGGDDGGDQATPTTASEGTGGSGGTGGTGGGNDEARCAAAEAAKEANARYGEVVNNGVIGLTAAAATPDSLPAALATFQQTLQQFNTDELPGIVAALDAYRDTLSNRRAEEVEALSSISEDKATRLAAVTSTEEVSAILAEASGQQLLEATVRVNNFTQEICGFPFVDQ